MTLIRKLALALYLALLCSSYSNSQTVDPTTGNLINFTGTPTATTSNWVNGVYVNQLCFQAGQPGNCGPNPSIRANSGNINFSYGQVDLHQIVNINAALAAGGNGVQLSGFNYSFTAKNGNGWDNGQQDYLAAYVKLYNSAGQLAANYDYSSQTNRKYNWTNFSFNETFATPQLASQYSTAQVGFVGRDTNYWAGNYGPEIMNVSFALKYRVDPCATNPAYSPSCAGYSNVVYSANIFNNNAWGQAMTQAVAVNQAFQNAGIGATVHGFNYAFDWQVGERQCTSWFIVCWSSENSNINVNVRMTNSGGNNLFSQTYNYSGENISGSASGKYLLPSSVNQTAIGSISMSSSGWGDAQAGNFRSSLIYTPDPCIADPMYSTMCKGYAVAYAKTMILGATVAAASAPIVTGPAPAPDVTAPMAAPDPVQQPQQQQSQQQSPAQQGPAPAPQGQDPNQNPGVAQDNPAQPNQQQPGPAPTGPQPAGGPPQTATASASSSSGPGGGGSVGPSKLAMSVVKTAQANDKATQTAAVQNAAKAFENTQQSSQAASNLAIIMNQDLSANSAAVAANFASQSTQTSIQSSQQVNQQSSLQNNTQTQQSSRVAQQMQQQTQTQQVLSFSGSSQIQQFVYTPPVQQQQDTQSTQIAMLKPPTPVVVEIQQSSSGTGLTITRNMFAYNPLMSLNSSNTSISIQQPQPTYQPKLDTRQSEVETPQFQVASFGGGRAGNPLSEIMMQQRFELMQNNIAQPGSSVNRNVQPNDLAVGVDLASMATVPAGFNAYSIVLKDSAFYEPKEVYKNQRTVDNERVLRGLTRGSDSLHQQMVDQQYKLGN